MFFRLIMLYILLCLCILYNLNVGYTSYWYFVLYLSCAYLFHHCVIFTSVIVLICLLMLRIWLRRYVCVLHTIRSLFALHLGNSVMHISCILFFIILLSSLLTFIHEIVLTPFCLNYLSHASKQISLFLLSKYFIYLSPL